MLDKSQLKTLSEFLVNLATAWLIAVVVVPSLTITAFSVVNFLEIIKGLVFGLSSLFFAVYLSKEK
ncbi:MAG: hypothetical protein Q8Q95_04085 [bacterium]|nr:hypothetical protein [bacterium]